MTDFGAVCGDRNSCNVYCVTCNRTIPNSPTVFREVNGDPMCTMCMSERIPTLTNACGYCNKTLEGLPFYTVGNEQFCRDCAEGYTIITVCCSVRYRQGSTYQIIIMQGGVSACENCIDAKAWHCDPCNEWVRRLYTCQVCRRDINGGVVRCSCGRGGKDTPIHNHSCIPTLVFHGEDEHNLFMGFELETQLPTGDLINKGANFAREALQLPEIAQLKEDGSIGGGFEIVTQPTTYSHYRNASSILWATIEQLRTDYRARSWDAGTCGLHIHVSRSGFLDPAHMHRFIAFIYRNTEMMMKFSGRKSSYAVFSQMWTVDEYEQPVFSVAHKLRVGGNKYDAVNTAHRDTLELRFMRGTMNPEGVLASLGLAHAMVEHTRTLEMAELPNSVSSDGDSIIAIEFDYSWASFAKYVGEHQDIYEELHERMPKIKALKLSDLKQSRIDA